MSDKDNQKPMTLNERLRIEFQQDQNAKIPKSDEQGPQKIVFEPLVHDPETSYMNSFFSTATNQTAHFFNWLMGKNYNEKYSFTYHHKFTIMKYIFIKNNLLGEQLQKDFKKHNNEEEIARLIKLQNRVVLVANLADCRNSIGKNAYSWGLLVGSLSMMLNISIWKRLALCGLIVHFAGSYACYSNVDRVFDKIYPFFLDDLEAYKKERQNYESLKKTKIDKEFEDFRLQCFIEDYYKNQKKSS